MFEESSWVKAMEKWVRNRRKTAVIVRTRYAAVALLVVERWKH